MAEHHARQGALQALRVAGATGNNLKGVTVDFPVGLLTCVTGVSGSGKSTLVNDTLYAAVARQLYRAHEEPAAHDEIVGTETLDKVIKGDRSPIGRPPPSNPATYPRLVHADWGADGRGEHRQGARLRPRALQLQRGRGPLRGLPGRRCG